MLVLDDTYHSQPAPRILAKVTPSLTSILQRPDVWRIGQLAGQVRNSIPTGFTQLDEALPDGGWEHGAMTELLTNEQGIGEFSVLLPAMRHITNAGRYVVMVNPPFIPLPITFQMRGVDLTRQVVVYAKGADMMWALEKVTRCTTGGLVVGWLYQTGNFINEKALRRLQHAANAGGTSLFLFRPTSARTNSSPAPTRIVISANRGNTQLAIIKRRAALMTTPISLSLYPKHWATRMQPETLKSGTNAQTIAQLNSSIINAAGFKATSTAASSAARSTGYGSKAGPNRTMPETNAPAVPFVR